MDNPYSYSLSELAGEPDNGWSKLSDQTDQKRPIYT